MVSFNTEDPIDIPSRPISAIPQVICNAIVALPEVNGNPALSEQYTLDELLVSIQPVVMRWAIRNCEAALRIQSLKSVGRWPSSRFTFVKAELSKFSRILTDMNTGFPEPSPVSAAVVTPLEREFAAGTRSNLSMMSDDAIVLHASEGDSERESHHSGQTGVPHATAGHEVDTAEMHAGALDAGDADSSLVVGDSDDSFGEDWSAALNISPRRPSQSPRMCARSRADPTSQSVRKPSTSVLAKRPYSQGNRVSFQQKPALGLSRNIGDSDDVYKFQMSNREESVSIAESTLGRARKRLTDSLGRGVKESESARKKHKGVLVRKNGKK
jgi:hypothetical protein